MCCEFCTESILHPGISGRIIYRKSGFWIMPTKGALAPGHILVLPDEHVTSFGELSDARLRVGLEVVEHARDVVTAAFGQAIAFEHGTGQDTYHSSACCEHAHTHIVPLPGRTDRIEQEYRDQGGAAAQLKVAEQLRAFAGDSYLALSMQPGRWSVWQSARRFPRQFGRQVVARQLGIPEKFNWRDHPMSANMEVTQAVLRERFCSVSDAA